MQSIDVLLDTSVLPRHAANPGQEYDHLIDLVEAGLLKVHVSDVVRREWRLQMQHVLCRKVDCAIRSVRDLRRDPLSKDLAHEDVLKELGDVADDLRVDAVRVANARCEKLLKQLGAEIHAIEGEDGSDVMDAYFAGEPPFKDQKARNDIPDAFIHQACRRLAEGGWKSIHAVAADNGLRDGLATIERVEVYESLRDFIASPPVQEASTTLELSQHWSEERTSQIVDQLRGRTFLHSKLESLMIDELCEHTAHGNIPEDNGEAMITGVYGLQNLSFDWDDVDDLSPGWIGVRFEFDCDAELEFMVNRADTFHVPDWVHVCIEDFEHNHYFEASASRTLRVEGMLTIRFTVDELIEEVVPDPTDVEIHEIDSIRIHDDEDDIG